MFKTKSLFSEVPCPYQRTCILPRCIFKHPESKANDAHSGTTTETHASTNHDQDGQRKRQKLDHEDVKSGHETKGSPTTQGAEERVQKRSLVATREISPPPLKRKSQNGQALALPTSPGPPISNTAKSSKGPEVAAKPTVKASLKQEALNPRVLKTPAPASHDMRYKLLKALHDQLKRLNAELAKDAKEEEEELVLSDQALITKALDLEEEATTSPSIYSNLVKNKILAYKRMSVKQWVDERSKEIAKAKALEVASSSGAPGSKSEGPPVVIQTDLNLHEELTLLHKLYTPISGLSKHGYVTSIPTDQDMETAKKGVEAAKGWEICDRCKTRFEVFPGRREEDGALTSGGKCRYHFGKPYFPERSATDPKAKREKRYRCCGEGLGESPGCTQAECHVFKISEVKRLAAVLNFEKTPENPSKESSKPVCIDGEMGYTVYGLELIRLTATSWPDNQLLFDVLVRPIGPILDLNSRYSGIRPKDLAEAPRWSPNTSPSASKSDRLPIVDSPAVARSLLFSHLSPNTPLIGHGLENDLNAARIIHPTIIDTALLFPHKAGLPFRNGLKALMHTHLNRHIQVVVDGKMEGHDSQEDASAAGELVRFALAEKWSKMKKQGWTIEDGQFKPPPKKGYVAKEVEDGHGPIKIQYTAGRKRQRYEMEADD